MEAWCAMQTATVDGLRPARGGEKRYTIVAIWNALEKHRQALEELLWSQSPKQMVARLARPDVAVTNEKDKVMMLPIVEKTEDRVREMIKNLVGPDETSLVETIAPEGAGGGAKGGARPRGGGADDDPEAGWLGASPAASCK